jgi:hypothetical protein
VDHAEQQRLHLGRAAKDLAVAGDHLILEAGVVEASLPEGRGLHGAAGHGTAQGDALKLRDHRRYQAVPHGGPHSFGEAHPRLGHASSAIDVDLQDAVEPGHVDRSSRESALSGEGHHVVHAALVDVGPAALSTQTLHHGGHARHPPLLIVGRPASGT